MEYTIRSPGNSDINFLKHLRIAVDCFPIHENVCHDGFISRRNIKVRRKEPMMRI